MSISPTFSGELQLAGWNESHSGGCKVVFWLPDSSDLDAFRALTVRKGNQAGHRFAAVLVEIGEDELPVTPPAPAPGARPKGGQLCRLAAQFCQQAHFQEWTNTSGPDEAAQWIRRTCEVTSRVQLDHDPEAAARFHARVRLPYLNHLHPQGAPQ
jgi:hypothetical protein